MSTDLLQEIADFVPVLPEEAAAKQSLLQRIRKYGEQILDRSCPAGHITCSGMILSPDLQKTLMAYHLIYQSVGWTGGHADGNPDLLGNALREAMEETSVQQIYPFSRRILSIDVLPVPPHCKHGKEVAAHLHYNITYGLIAPENQRLADKPDENRDVRWIPVEDIAAYCTELHMIPIYQKLIDRMKQLAVQKTSIPAGVPARLLDWYPAHHRDLPWRKDTEPYHIWVSEIMLQQTRVEAVKGYYARFLEALPNIAALADCPEEQLLKLWEGLGYYSRVRNLQKAAKIIMTDHQGKFPSDYASVRKLPGIGDYTAGAICSICYGLPAPAVDGNVQRVFARLQEDFRNILDPKQKNALSLQLAAVYPGTDCGTLTQALIEVGATVCLPNGTPLCAECPLSSLCMAREAGSTGMLPVRIQRTKRRMEQRTVFVLQCDGKIAIRKRPAKGLLAGLWELPNTENFLTPEEAVALCSSWNVRPKELLQTVQRKHIFTHITWEMQGIFLTCSSPDSRFVWAKPEELEQIYSLPTAFRCIFT